MTQLQSKINELVKKIGMRPAALHFGCSYESLKSVIAGLPVRPGTLALIEANLKKPAAAPKKKPTKKAPKKVKAKAASKPKKRAPRPKAPKATEEAPKATETNGAA